MSNDSEDTQDVGVGAMAPKFKYADRGSYIAFSSPDETMQQYANRVAHGSLAAIAGRQVLIGGKLEIGHIGELAKKAASSLRSPMGWGGVTVRQMYAAGGATIVPGMPIGSWPSKDDYAAIYAAVNGAEGTVGLPADDIDPCGPGQHFDKATYKCVPNVRSRRDRFSRAGINGVEGVPAFVPRQITRVKPYAYQVRKGDTLATIAGAFGVGAERIPELVGANMEGRPLRPLRLGAPSRAMTLAGLAEGESLRIPARWPDPQWASGMVGDPVDMNSALAQGMNLAMQTMQASDQIPTLPKDQASTALATAMAWFANANGPAPALKPMDYTAFIANAVNWITQIALPVSQAPSGPSIAQLGMFPWGPLATMLNAGNNPYATANWAGMIPGSPSVPWSILPWDLLAKNASILNLGQGIGPITWPMPSQVNPGTVRMSFMDAAQLQPECPAGQFRDPGTGACMNVCPPFIDGKPVVYHPESNSCIIATPIASSCPQGQTHADPQDDTSPCVDICAGQPGTFYSAATGKCEPVCPYGYDPNTKMCKPAPTGGDPGSGNTTNQAPAAEKKSSTMTAVLAVGAVAAAGGLIWWATRGKKSAPSAG